MYILTLLIKLICRVHHRNARMDEPQAAIKITWRNINNLRYAGDTTLMEESKEELKSLLKMKEESEKVGLKLSIQPSQDVTWSLQGHCYCLIELNTLPCILPFVKSYYHC